MIESQRPPGRTRGDAVRTLAGDAGRTGGRIAGFLLAALVAPLPAAWRAGLERRHDLPVDQAGGLSALAQLLVGAGLLLAGFAWWMQGQLDEVSAVAKEMGRTGRHGQEDYEMMGHALLGMNPLLPVIYALTTPTGLLATAVAAGGFVRCLHSALHRGNRADPWLSLVEHARTALDRRGQAKLRERRKGEATPDEILAGDGAPWHLRIVSREDYDWPSGVTVVVDGRPYRVVERREIRDEAGRLRTAWDLALLGPTDVMRGPRAYRPSMPPVSMPPLR